jgi:hypothetical protein
LCAFFPTDGVVSPQILSAGIEKRALNTKTAVHGYGKHV